MARRTLVSMSPLAALLVASLTAAAVPACSPRHAEAATGGGPSPADTVSLPDTTLTPTAGAASVPDPSAAATADSTVDSAKAAAGYTDAFWGVELPNPLPAPGARVRVTGVYGRSFALASSGAETDPFMGLLTYRSLEQIEPAPELATLPGVRRAKR
jgi:hypothetical protein